ncbi:MAG: hypothetical protein J7L77_03565 [Clostridiales bacterium]|nr:hypothetical protein [Clostridiales bacterium]
MSMKSLDNKGRWRNRIVSFRMSEQENDELNRRVGLSGLPKQEYLIKRCFEKDIVVIGNPRVYKALKNEMNVITKELMKVSEGKPISDELLDRVELINKTMKGMSKKTSNPER